MGNLKHPAAGADIEGGLEGVGLSEIPGWEIQGDTCGRRIRGVRGFASSPTV